MLNVLHNVVVLNDGEVVSPDMLPDMMTAARPASAGAGKPWRGTGADRFHPRALDD